MVKAISIFVLFLYYLFTTIISGSGYIGDVPLHANTLRKWNAILNGITGNCYIRTDVFCSGEFCNFRFKCLKDSVVILAMVLIPVFVRRDKVPIFLFSEPLLVTIRDDYQRYLWLDINWSLIRRSNVPSVVYSEIHRFLRVILASSTCLLNCFVSTLSYKNQSTGLATLRVARSQIYLSPTYKTMTETTTASSRSFFAITQQQKYIICENFKYIAI